MQYEVFGKSLKMSEPTLWSYLVLAVKTMIKHDCYDDLKHLAPILRGLETSSLVPCPRWPRR